MFIIISDLSVTFKTLVVASSYHLPGNRGPKILKYLLALLPMSLIARFGFFTIRVIALMMSLKAVFISFQAQGSVTVTPSMIVYNDTSSNVSITKSQGRLIIYK